MNHQSKSIPMEIFGLIVAQCSDEVLQNIRLTCRAGREIATPLLFQCFRVQALNYHTFIKLTEVAKRPQLASLVKKFEYRPRIRRNSYDDDEHRQLEEQNKLPRELKVPINAFIKALKSFTQLCHIELQYPPFRMRGVWHHQSLHVLSWMIRYTYGNIWPRLVSLNIVGLLLSELPRYLLQNASDGTEATLATIAQLNLDFHPGDMPSGEITLIDPDGLRRLLSMVTNLTFLRIGFHFLDKSMRGFDWSVLQCTKLSTLELVQLEMSATSLLNIITQNANSIRHIILDSVFLFDGTWAAVYDRMASIEGINDISEIRDRRYVDDLDDGDSNKELDAASYHRLFALVEKRRESKGLPSMRWPISPAGSVYHRDFSHMETS